MNSDRTEYEAKTTSPQPFKDSQVSINVERYHFSGEPERVPYSRKGVYKIWLVSSGNTVHLADKSVHIHGPALAFFSPGAPYASDGLDQEHIGYWCIFTEEFLKSNDKLGGLQKSPLFKTGSDAVFPLTEYQLPVIIFFFDQIIAELASGYAHKNEVIKNYIDLLIHEGMKLRPILAAGQCHNNAASRIAYLFLESLELQFPIASPHQPLKLKKAGEFALYLSVHVNHLNAVVKEVTGKSTSSHIAERMADEGQSLLKHTNWSIADIAYSFGFEYPSHFSNFFKKQTGITPLAFRKKQIL